MTLMTAIAFAGIYRYWGNLEYAAGNLMMLVSIGATALAMVLGFGFVGVFMANFALGVIFFVYHLSRPAKKDF